MDARRIIRFFSHSRLLLCLLISSLFLSACSNSRIVQPLNKKEWQASASIGGPIINHQEKTQIVPLHSVTGAYGVTQNITGFASWYPSSLLQSIYQFDGGMTHELLHPFSIQPGLTYTANANVIYGKSGGFKFYPQVDVNLYWILPNRDFTYIGMSNWFELGRERAHGLKQEKFWIPGLHVGYTKRYNAYGLNAELKYIAPFDSNENKLIQFSSPSDKGALGLHFSVSYNFK